MSKNSIMKYAMERAKKHLQRTKKIPHKTKDSNVDDNGVDLNVLVNGGATRFKSPSTNKYCMIYVHCVGNDNSLLQKAKYHFLDACGSRVFIRTNKREIAQEFINIYYGKGMYTASTAVV